MASAHPLALDPDSRAPTPLLIFTRSHSPSSHRSLPKPILGTRPDRLDTPTTQISSLATHTVRPSPPHSLQSTIKGLGPCLNSYQQMLARLGPHQPATEHASSLATVKPLSRLDLARLKVDELEFEVCFRCGEERDQGDVNMLELEGWGLQWVCKERCKSEGVEVAEPKGTPNPEVADPNLGREQLQKDQS